jgi:hypothetical protein
MWTCAPHGGVVPLVTSGAFGYICAYCDRTKPEIGAPGPKGCQALGWFLSQKQRLFL